MLFPGSFLTTYSHMPLLYFISYGGLLSVSDHFQNQWHLMHEFSGNMLYGSEMRVIITETFWRHKTKEKRPVIIMTSKSRHILIFSFLIFVKCIHS